MREVIENPTVGAFAKAAGVIVETVRFYQRMGLLLEPRRPHGSIRVRARLTGLTRMEAALAKLVRACDTRRGQVSCPLIFALHGG